MENNKKSAYPSQVGAIKRANKVLGVDAILRLPTEKEVIPPLQIHSGFSRFEFTIVDSKNKTTPTANIPAPEIPFIMANTIAVLNARVSTCIDVKSPQDEVASGIAYTTKLIDKNFKGLSPAEVLLSDINNKEKLINIKNWLNSNITKYPGNKTQIDAIDQAIELLEIGELKPINTDSQNTGRLIEIYKTDYKFKSKKNAKGYNLIYGISIYYDSGKNYPFALNIINCFAPVETLPTKQKNIKMNMAEDMVKASMLMNESEWFALINRINSTLKHFELINFKEQYQKAIAEAYSYKN